jgi:hypothetical protein
MNFDLLSCPSCGPGRLKGDHVSESTSRLPARPSLEQLSKQAKELLRQSRSGESGALARFAAAKPQSHDAAPAPEATLADAQFVLARECGFETWAKLKQHIETIRPPGIDRFEDLAEALSEAYSKGDAEAIRQINRNNGTSFVWEFKAVDMQRRLPRWFASGNRTPDLARADAQDMVAQSNGFENWKAFVASFHQAPADPRSAPVFLSTRPPFYTIDWKENKLTARGPQSDPDWDAIFAVMKEHGIAKLNAAGITDAAVKRLIRLDDVTELDIGGSKALTDDGAVQLAGMPQLQVLSIGGWDTPLTDRALLVLRSLPELRRFGAGWAQGITDAGLANLAFCEHLEDVNLMGTHAGDGAIQSLAGKSSLRRLRTGAGVTDRGIASLHQLPRFKAWQDGQIKYALMNADAEPTYLLLDGPFTNAGLASLAGLDGLFGLGFFWHCPAFTAAGLDSLRGLANLGFLGCQGKRCDNEAMRRIASLPRLRMLMGQNAVADDDGFEALSRSKSIEYFWGRECPNFGGRGFVALSSMPALRGIGINCKNVDHTSLSSLPRFPALRELVPMGVPDSGFRHIGQCESLEGLWCMYCQDTGDAATEHIAGLKKLKAYYAGETKITDRSLEILGGLTSLETIGLWQCASLTGAGIAHLTGLPNLRELTLDGLPGVTKNVLADFPARVRVNYTG